MRIYQVESNDEGTRHANCHFCGDLTDLHKVVHDSKEVRLCTHCCIELQDNEAELKKITKWIYGRGHSTSKKG